MKCFGKMLKAMYVPFLCFCGYIFCMVKECGMRPWVAWIVLVLALIGTELLTAAGQKIIDAANRKELTKRRMAKTAGQCMVNVKAPAWKGSGKNRIRQHKVVRA